MAASRGLAVLGIVVLMRGGGASFGQGMFFAIGAYIAALVPQALGISDGILRALLGTLAAGAVAAVFAPLLARYRGIFYAMLTLALSMVLYGILSKASMFGGTDGLTVVKPMLFGTTLGVAHADYALYAVTVCLAAIAAWGVRVYSRSVAGLLAQAVRANALRVEYLGASARRSLSTSFVLCGLLGGLGGAITAQALGHVEPNFTDWTTSGEFVFIAVLAGTQSVAAVFVASLLLEIVRSFSNLYFPNTWQLALGAFLLLVIWFRPEGIGSLWMRRRKAFLPAALVEARGSGTRADPTAPIR
jgi:branched-chain amino acid transport system permease protein